LNQYNNKLEGKRTFTGIDPFYKNDLVANIYTDVQIENEYNMMKNSILGQPYSEGANSLVTNTKINYENPDKNRLFEFNDVYSENILKFGSKANIEQTKKEELSSNNFHKLNGMKTGDKINSDNVIDAILKDEKIPNFNNDIQKQLSFKTMIAKKKIDFLIYERICDIF
jgi:hypothetical protein